jgi:hypothetical protein
MKIIKFLVSPLFMGVLFVVFAASMAAATFIENDYGSSAAYNFVYDTRWFELILLLLTINLTGQIVVFKLYKRSKLTVMIFHLAFIVMVAGAGITGIQDGRNDTYQGRRGAKCLLLKRKIPWIHPEG